MAKNTIYLFVELLLFLLYINMLIRFNEIWQDTKIYGSCPLLGTNDTQVSVRMTAAYAAFFVSAA